MLPMTCVVWEYMDANKILKIVIIILALILFASHAIAAERLVFETFEDQDWSDSFDGTFNSANVSIVQFGSSHSGDYVARMYGGYLGAAFDYNVSPSNGSEYYIKYYVYYPSNWSWSNISDTNMKQFRAMGENGYPVFVYGKYNNEIRTLGGFTNYSRTGVCSNGTWYGPISTPSLEGWHEVEMYVKYADSGGGFWWKVDDQFVTPYNGTLDCDTWPSESGDVTNLRICGGNGFSDDDYYYIDDVEIWDGLPTDTSRTIQGITISD